MIDERSKAYSYAGDDRVNQAVTGEVKMYIQHTDYLYRSHRVHRVLALSAF
jgi:hypothetical protein